LKKWSKNHKRVKNNPVTSAKIRTKTITKTKTKKKNEKKNKSKSKKNNGDKKI